MNSLLAFQSHLKLAHCYWEQQLQLGDCAIDATCGNGHDTLKLCELVLSLEGGKIFAFDIQEDALKTTQNLVQSKLAANLLSQVTYINECHSDFKGPINRALTCSDRFQLEPVKLIVYNLGYLPGGDKGLTTAVNTTLHSVQAAAELIAPGGLISITCYPGHPEGALEETAILEMTASFSRFDWNCCHHRWINKKNAPSLLLLQKNMCIKNNTHN
ncbi:MAG: class I SAM-dependent methyltransferase [Parachlamydiaceae bacterium]|nr:class I SAM-dependent methyltransferase [Parachlamydiaceae bacterium]